MALALPLVQLMLLLSNVWATYKTLKPLPKSRRASAPPVRAVAARKRELKSCLAVWIIWAACNCAERITDRTVGLLVPFYTDIKTLFLILLFFTRGMAAEPLLLHLIRPALKPYIPAIDAALELSRAIADVVVHFCLMPWRFISEDTTRNLEAVQQTSSAPQPADNPPTNREHSDMLADGKPIEEVIVQKPTTPAVSPTSEHVERGITTRKRRGMQAPNNGNGDGSVNYPGHSLAPDTRGDGLIPAPPQPFIVQAVPKPPQPVVSTLPLYPPVARHSTDPNITRTPRFPGGYAASIGQSDGGRSTTAVQTIPTPSPVPFSFPEAPAIEVYRPGSSAPSEMPRSRLPAEVTRNPHEMKGSGTANAAGQDSRPLPRTMYSQRQVFAPGASSATVAAEARLAFRSAGPSGRNPGDDPSSRHLPSTSAVPGPLPSTSEPPHTRRGIASEGEKTRQPPSTAALVRRERKTSASIARPNTATRVPPAPAGASERTRRTRPERTTGESSSSSSATTSSSANSQNKAVNAGKKRSVAGHVVESPRIESATEVESATDEDHKPSPSGSAKKRRRVNDSPVEPGILPAPNAAPPVPSKDKNEDSGYEDDESWSALDELRTPHRNALSLRSRTIFSDDAPSLADPAAAPPFPRPALTLQIPTPPAKGKQTRAVNAAANTTTLAGVDALAGFAALSRGELASRGTGSVRLGHGNAAEGVPPIRVSKGNAAAAARGLRLRSAASRVL